MDQTFRFSVEEHIYTLGAQRLPSVTDILGALGFIDKRWFTGEARERGRAVHIATHYLEEGDLDLDSLKATEEALQQPVVPYVRGWERFLRETGWKSTHIEGPGYDPSLLVAGCPDRRGNFPEGKRHGLEIKTGAPEGWWEYQVGGYSEIFKLPLADWTIVRLKADADFILESVKDLNAGSKFLSMATVYDCGRKHGIYDAAGK